MSNNTNQTNRSKKSIAIKAAGLILGFVLYRVAVVQLRPVIDEHFNAAPVVEQVNK